MPRAFVIISILLTILLSIQVFAGGNGPFFRYLKEPAVKWENNVITGQLTNVPVKGLLEELLRKEGYSWEVIGDLKGSLSISFDNMTINESIKKIMRLGHFNFVLIFDRDDPADITPPHRIKNLMIYQGQQRIRFSRSAQQIPAPKQKKVKKVQKPDIGEPAVALPAPPSAKETKGRNTWRPQPTEEEIADIEKEMKAVADEMLAEKIITQEEYNELIGEMEKQNNGNN